MVHSYTPVLLVFRLKPGICAIYTVQKFKFWGFFYRMMWKINQENQSRPIINPSQSKYFPKTAYHWQESTG